MRRLDALLAEAEAEWRAMGASRADRTALSTDLRHELTTAMSDGLSLEQLLADTDITTLARNTAVEAGITTRAPNETKALLLTVLAGATPGLLIVLLLHRIPLSPFAGIATAYLGILLAVGKRMKDDPAGRGTVRALAWLLPLAGLVAAPMTALIHTRLNSSMGPVGTQVAGLAVIAVPVAAAVLLAHRRGFTQFHDHQGPRQRRRARHMT